MADTPPQVPKGDDIGEGIDKGIRRVAVNASLLTGKQCQNEVIVIFHIRNI